jgi:hypothetical protein
MSDSARKSEPRSERSSEHRAANQRIARKYLRPQRSFSIFGALLGLMLGIVGGIYYAWYINPAEQVDIVPSQLDAASRERYMAAVALAFAGDGDLNRAVNRLLALRLDGDPIQSVADAACSLSTSDYANNSGGRYAVRAMMYFYQLQRRVGCADQQIAEGAIIPPTFESAQIVALSTPTPALASKTPTPPVSTSAATIPTPTAASLIFPTEVSLAEFGLATISTFCDPRASGVIEVYVYDTNGASQLPGQEIRVRWTGVGVGTNENRFFTGLKPELGQGYADFRMSEGIDYTLDMPGRSEPLNQPLSAAPCTSETGERALRSYRVAFRSLT